MPPVGVGKNMEVQIKNATPQTIFFDLRNIGDKPPIKILDMIAPGDIGYGLSTGGAMHLVVTSSADTWQGYVPANTTEPIIIGRNPSGTVEVSFDETRVPDLSPSFFSDMKNVWNDKPIRYACIGASVLLMSLIVYYVYVCRKKSK